MKKSSLPKLTDLIRLDTTRKATQEEVREKRITQITIISSPLGLT